MPARVECRVVRMCARLLRHATVDYPRSRLLSRECLESASCVSRAGPSIETALESGASNASVSLALLFA